MFVIDWFNSTIQFSHSFKHIPLKSVDLQQYLRNMVKLNRIRKRQGFLFSPAYNLLEKISGFLLTKYIRDKQATPILASYLKYSGELTKIHSKLPF